MNKKANFLTDNLGWLMLFVAVLAVSLIIFFSQTNKTTPITEGATNKLTEQYKNLDFDQLTPDLQTQLINQGAEGKSIVLLAEARDYYARGKDAQEYPLIEIRKEYLQLALQKTQQTISTLQLDEKSANYNEQPAVQLLNEIQATITTILTTEQMANLNTDADYQAFIKERQHTIIGSVAQANYLYIKSIEQNEFTPVNEFKKDLERQPLITKAFGYYTLAYFHKNLVGQISQADDISGSLQESKDYATKIPSLTIDKTLLANTRLLHANILYQEKDYTPALLSYEKLLKNYNYQGTQGLLETGERSIMENNFRTLDPAYYSLLRIDMTMDGTIENNDEHVINLPTPIKPQDQSLLQNYNKQNYPQEGETITFIVDKQGIAQALKIDEVHGIETTSEFKFTLTIYEGLFNQRLCTVTTRLIPVSMKNGPNVGWPIGIILHQGKGVDFPNILEPEERSNLGTCVNNNHVYAKISSHTLDTEASDSGRDEVTILLEISDWNKPPT